jgi:uncharacterized membrane protein YbhN (UPF0104 family)
MKLAMKWGAAVAAVWLVVVLALFTIYTRAADTLAEARLPYLATSALMYSVGFLVFGAVWTLLVSLSLTDRPGIYSNGRCFGASILSLAGLLTPMNIGTDVLRSLFGKTYLGLPPALTAAASIATRESKLHVSLALLPAIAAAAGMNPASPGKRMLLVFAATFGVALVFYLFRSDVTGGLSKSLRLESLANATKALNRKVGWGTRFLCYLLFVSGFVFEWLALQFCFMAFGMFPDLRITFAGFGILYFLSRTPVLPLGIGLVETGAFALLRTLHISVEQAGALVIAWGFLRVAAPSAGALIAFLFLSASGFRRGKESKENQESPIVDKPDAL